MDSSLALTEIAGANLTGVEAQRIYLHLNRNTAAYSLVEDVLPLSFELHVGRRARDLIAHGLATLRECTTEAQVDEAFAASRQAYEQAGFAAQLTQDRVGAWRRTMVVSGLDTAAGHIVDVGNRSNLFGEELLRRNPRCTCFTGVDPRPEPVVRTGDRLHFAKQDDEHQIPLAAASADVVAFRLSLHHTAKPVQESLLREAVRVLRPGGEILIIEDSFTDTAGLTDNALTMQFGRLQHDDKIAALSLLDVSSCLMRYETVAYPLSYRSVAEWSDLLRLAGCDAVDSTYWGFTMFTLYAAPMAVIRARVAG